MTKWQWIRKKTVGGRVKNGVLHVFTHKKPRGYDISRHGPKINWYRSDTDFSALELGKVLSYRAYTLGRQRCNPRLIRGTDSPIHETETGGDRHNMPDIKEPVAAPGEKMDSTRTATGWWSDLFYAYLGRWRWRAAPKMLGRCGCTGSSFLFFSSG